MKPQVPQVYEDPEEGGETADTSPFDGLSLGVAGLLLDAAGALSHEERLRAMLKCLVADAQGQGISSPEELVRLCQAQIGGMWTEVLILRQDPCGCAPRG